MPRPQTPAPTAPVPFTPAAGRLLLCGALLFGALVSSLAPAAESASEQTHPGDSSVHGVVSPTGRG